MREYTDEELDRALFALDLEEPPADLRASILAATAFRPPAIVNLWEAAGLAATCIAILWFVFAIAAGGAPLLTHTAAAVGRSMAAFFSNVNSLAWLALGGATAVWLSLGLNGPSPVRERSARR